MANFQRGSRVKIELSETSPWRNHKWFKGGYTGTIEKLFKNGKIAVAVDQLTNKSNDGKTTLYFRPADLVEI